MKEKSLAEQFRTALDDADRLFGALQDGAWLCRPIALRHPCIFYYGHLPAFAWNQAFRFAQQEKSFNAEFDVLFERGIDPPDTAELASGEQTDVQWPSIDRIFAYKQRIESELLALLANESELNPNLRKILKMVLEHYLMHLETFSYMLHQLPYELKKPFAGELSVHAGAIDTVSKRDILSIPPGVVTLGADKNDLDFGWCNEFGRANAAVDSFSIDRLPVTNGEFLEFVESGGYNKPDYWSADGWEWLQKNTRRHPQFWQRENEVWYYRGMWEPVPLPLDAPVWVSFVEAQAYAQWKGARLPSEVEYHRAAYGTEDGERAQPWGEATASAELGDFGLLAFDPDPVGSHPEGRSYFGVEDLVGGGWEWTSSAFAPFAGFEALPSYPGYSADFFDGQHYVLKGASPMTAHQLVRRSFRNWFQPHYPFVYAKFRCAYSSDRRVA